MFELLTSKLAWTIAGAVGVVGTLALLWKGALRWIDDWQEKRDYEDKIKAAHIEAQKYADAPAGDDDFHAKMKKRIEEKA